ncbi:MAG: general secretion pathway protein GspK [Gemmatimonadetes bacterium]|nr:general secretion pathway protein GspK [Gemmatimonadota bacterium]
MTPRASGRGARPRVSGAAGERGGFALVSVLWILVGLAALGLAANLAARQAVAAARNRADLAASAWRAEACVERARAAIHDALWEARHEPPGATVWGRLDGVVAGSPGLAGMACALQMRAAGAALDVNAAPDETLRRLFVALGRSPAGADSLADALADWRDEDDAPRPAGAVPRRLRATAPSPTRASWSACGDSTRCRGSTRCFPPSPAACR